MRFCLVAFLAVLPVLAPLPVLAGYERPASPAAADEAPAPVPALTAQQQADLKRVEEYINSVTTVAARFTQKADFGDGTAGVVTGHFRLWRPGRLRIDYDPPNEDFIVADGNVIHQWDGQMRQVSQMSIGDTLPGFLLRRSLRFEGDDVTVTGVAHPAPDRMEISLRSAADPGAGELSLVFSEVPLRLVGWRVIDAQQLTTEVLLEDVQQGVRFERADFVFRKPAGRGVK